MYKMSISYFSPFLQNPVIGPRWSTRPNTLVCQYSVVSLLRGREVCTTPDEQRDVAFVSLRDGDLRLGSETWNTGVHCTSDKWETIFSRTTSWEKSFGRFCGLSYIPTHIVVSVTRHRNLWVRFTRLVLYRRSVGQSGGTESVISDSLRTLIPALVFRRLSRLPRVLTSHWLTWRTWGSSLG